MCDLESAILYWNQSAERVYGWSAEEALGKRADELLYGAASARPLAGIKGLIADGEWHGELTQVDRLLQGRKLSLKAGGRLSAMTKASRSPSWHQYECHRDPDTAGEVLARPTHGKRGSARRRNCP